MTNFTKSNDEKLIINFFCLKFKDPNIESDFNQLVMRRNYYLKVFVHSVYILLIILRLSLSVLREDPIIKYTNLLLFIILIILEILYYLVKKFKDKKIIEIIISFFFIFSNIFNVIVVSFFLKVYFPVLEMRALYNMIIPSFTEILLMTEYNFFQCISFFLLNISTCLTITILKNNEYRYYVELIVAIILIVLAIFYKIQNSIINF